MKAELLIKKSKFRNERNKNAKIYFNYWWRASDLGLELSKRFAKDKNNLLIISSNITNLNNAKKDIESEFGVDVKVLALDLSNPDNFVKVKNFTDENDIFVNNLVNCAGFGDCTDFQDMDIDLQHRMAELNCNCPLCLMNVYVKDMLKNNEGKIMNISSIAAFFPGPYMSTYHASKAFLLNLSEGVARELKGTNVHLISICPGPFNSGFLSKAKNYKAFESIKPLSANEVADISYKGYQKNKNLLIIGFKNKLMIFFSRFVSRKMVADTSAKTIKG